MEALKVLLLALMLLWGTVVLARLERIERILESIDANVERRGW